MTPIPQSQTATQDKCKCGDKANVTHPCPYSVELYGDDKTECDCCDECEDNCRMEV